MPALSNASRFEPTGQELAEIISRHAAGMQELGPLLAQ
jgi:hypothetical protein